VSLAPDLVRDADSPLILGSTRMALQKLCDQSVRSSDAFIECPRAVAKNKGRLCQAEPPGESSPKPTTGTCQSRFLQLALKEGLLPRGLTGSELPDPAVSHTRIEPCQ